MLAPVHRNVLGGPLAICSTEPLTGFYRTGCCHSGADDRGLHTVCAIVNGAFLAYSRDKGNDLISPRPQYGFAGLKPGDRWCLCAARWLEAFTDRMAPPVVLEATHERTLEIVPLEALLKHAYQMGGA